MIDASKFPRVPVVPVVDIGQPPPFRIEHTAVERSKTKLAAESGAQNSVVAPKTMTLQGGRYYVVAEKK